jgi:hypothetical protein
LSSSLIFERSRKKKNISPGQEEAHQHSTAVIVILEIIMPSPKEGGALSSSSIGRASPFGRSVLDYVTPRELDQALQHQRQSSLSKMEEIAAQAAANKNKNAPTAADHDAAETTSSRSDWKLPIPDPDTEPQSAETEVQRLLTLKSYMVLDAEKEDAFDQLTREAREVFGVPTSLISLIDLGRQFLFRYVLNMYYPQHALFL